MSMKAKPQHDGYINPCRGERQEMTYQAANYVNGKRVRKLDYAIVPIPEPGYPTDIPPGTHEKVLVVAERYGRTEALFHPFDARYEGDPRPAAFMALDWDDRVAIVREQLAGSPLLADVA